MSPDQHVERLKATGSPEVLTVNGEAQVVIQSVEGYQRLVDEAEFARHIKALRHSLEQAKRGEGRPVDDVLNELAKKHNFEL